VLTSHYRAPLSYSEEGLESAKRAAERLRIAASLPGGEGDSGIEAETYRKRFVEAMDDDLNTAGGLATLFDLAREINRARDEGRCVEEPQQTLRELAGVLGLTLREPEAGAAAGPFIDLLVAIRNELRARKQFGLADSIRSRLGELGIALEDVAEGTRWRRRG
jgi:cysteinyl-tRNA synthetase